ncbi:MAG: M57 family metalloprotease [Kofleriaceae bacterium]
MIKSLLATGLVFGFASCALDQPVEYSSTAGMSFEEFRDSVQRETGTNYYIVDWDRVLKNDDELREFWSHLQQGALAIFNNGTDIKWTETQKINLTYCVGATFGARKQQVIDAMAAATENGWEKFANVNFIHVVGEDANCTAANTNVLFDVNQVTGQPYLARSFFPNSGRAERNVNIDTTSFDPAQTGNIPLANILGHELGHVLGFRHEHIRPEANAGQCAEDNQFRGLTTYDSASVMHYPQCNGTSATLSFTTRDQQGVSMVYGAPLAPTAPMAQVSFPADGQEVAATFDVQASVVDTDLVKAELFVDGVAYDTLTTGPFTFHVEELALGAHQLQVVGTDGSGQTGQVTISVTVVPGGSGGGNGSGSGNGNGDGDGSSDISGGCSTGGSGAGLALGLGLLGLVIRRRRR